MSETRKCILSAYLVFFISLAVLFVNYDKPPDKGYPLPDLNTWKVWLTRLYSGSTSGDLAVDMSFYTCFIVAAVCFVTVAYTWIFTLYHPNTRLWLMTLAASVWGLRLTYNFVRRGGYGWPPWSGEEDYSLQLLLDERLYVIFLNTCIRTFSIILLVYIEYTADQQQYDFQTYKYSLINSEQKLHHPYNVGFPCHKLFSVCRHPNYTAEMSIWFVFYLYTVSAGASLINWSLIGAVLLALLFQGSTLLSESITTGKYNLYTRYKSEVPRFLGLFNPFKSSYPALLEVRE